MTDQDFDFIRAVVRDRSAIALEDGKQYLVESRLEPIIRDLGLGSISDLVGLLRSPLSTVLQQRVVEAMVTTETMFFRDVLPFEMIRKVILPDLVLRRAAERRLNVWCAACSTGQEPYSFAILIREYFPELSAWEIKILATDLSRDVLSRAREGVYKQAEVNRGLPASLLLKHFRQQGTSWKLHDDVRTMVDFQEFNLVRTWPPLPPMDLVFLRNVMIYFDVETKKAILGRMARVLRPDGYLLLGGAETTFNLDNSYRRLNELKTGFYQVNR
ncbi:MAG: protein-glutamate O-methyltransferase CheR [Isosphaeraceae bacterium]